MGLNLTLTANERRVPRCTEYGKSRKKSPTSSAPLLPRRVAEIIAQDVFASCDYDIETTERYVPDTLWGGTNEETIQFRNTYITAALEAERNDCGITGATTTSGSLEDTIPIFGGHQDDSIRLVGVKAQTIQTTRKFGWYMGWNGWEMAGTSGSGILNLLLSVISRPCTIFGSNYLPFRWREEAAGDFYIKCGRT